MNNWTHKTRQYGIRKDTTRVSRTIRQMSVKLMVDVRERRGIDVVYRRMGSRIWVSFLADDFKERV